MAGGEVFIACKAPNGIVLNLDRYEKINDQNAIRRIVGPQTVTLKGWSRTWGAPDNTVGGYMITPVPVDFWNRWLELNLDSPLIADGIILGPHRDAPGQARDNKAIPQMFAPAKEGDVRGIARMSNDMAA